jgi:class 3 adenylate cyclase
MSTSSLPPTVSEPRDAGVAYLIVSEPVLAHTGTATVLFTDLVGSTELRARVGEDAAETLRRTHDRLLADVVVAHRGTVVKGIGDGIMATFAGAADAVAAAVTMQQAIDAHNRRAGADCLRVRIGISIGDVTWEQNDCFGTPVVEAARLCAAAEGGQILVAELVRLMTRGRGCHRFAPVGHVVLKGLPAPVAACVVAWEPVGHVDIPLPPRVLTGPAFAMLGRASEEEALSLAWEEAKNGQRQVVLVAGEPGIGTTRLAAAVARAAHAEGGSRFRGAEQEDDQLPYASFVEALRRFVGHALQTCRPLPPGRTGASVPGVSSFCRPRRRPRSNASRCSRRVRRGVRMPDGGSRSSW